MSVQLDGTTFRAIRFRWQRLLGGGLILFLIIMAMGLAHWAQTLNSRQVWLQQRMHALTEELGQLRQEQAMPSLVLRRYRNSICYIFGIYNVSFAHHSPIQRVRISGTGFVIADGLIATNRHVAEPWYKDGISEELVANGAKPSLEKLIAYFPGSPSPVTLGPAVLSQEADVALIRMAPHPHFDLQPIPLSSDDPTPGELVAVVGYPMGVSGMVAKVPRAVDARLTPSRDDQSTAGQLAALSLIRPSATCGHLGDVVGDNLIYDAPTAHGASGGPVFNSRAEVVGINAGYIDGFSGGTLGVSSQRLWPLIEKARKQLP